MELYIAPSKNKSLDEYKISLFELDKECIIFF